MAGDDVTITVRVNDNTAAGFRDVNGRLRDLRGRFASTTGDMRRNSDDLTRSLGGVASSAMSLTPALYGVAGALGISLLPAVGAAAPAMIGLGAAAGTLKLGFAGVSDAVELAGKDHKKYAEALKKMGPEQRGFTRALVDVKKEFSGFGKEIQKAMLPGFTKAVKDAGPIIKILGKSMTELGGAFGDAAEGVGRMMKDSGFQRDFAANLKLGTGFVKDMTSAMGPFVRSFLDFGAKSKPTLDALTNLAGGVLSKGLPGMFKGLETGIGGAAQVLDGFGYAINKILPAFGEFSGAFAKALGPYVKQGLMLLGDAAAGAFRLLADGMKAAAPLLKDLSYGLKSIRDVAETIAPTLKDIGAGIISAFLPVGNVKNAKGTFQQLNDAIQRNKGAIQEAARVFGDAVFDMTEMALEALPSIIKGFQAMATGVLTAIDGLVSGAAKAFGDLPIVGDKFKTADREFDKFKNNFLSGLGTAAKVTDNFAATTLPKLQAGQLRMDIRNWEAQIKTAKGQLDKVPPGKRADLKATIADLQSKVNAAKRKLGEIKDKTAAVKAKDQASSKLGYIQRLLNSLNGRVAVTTVKTVYSESHVAPRFHSAMGGPIRLAGGGTPDGGRVAGPGTGTSDSIPAMLSNGEYVIRASSVQKYGQRFMDAVNSGSLRVAGFASGGVTKAEREARNAARSDLTISHFGVMGGYQHSEFGSALAKPDSLSSLINSLNQWRSIIMKATHGSTENRLLKQLDSTGRKLLGYEKSLSKVTASLDKAKDKLNSLKDAAASLASSVKGGILSSANITRSAQGEAPVTVASIMGGLTASRDKATSFDKALKDLKKKGLSASLIQQIAEAGIEGGGLETAGALLRASSSEIKSMNSLQSQISSAAGSAGKTTSDAVYASQIKVQDALVKSLTRSQDKLKSAMDKLTKAMEKAIERAFAAGGVVGAAASGGLRGGLTMVGEHGFELLDLPAGSRVWSNPDSRRKVAAAQAPWASMLSAPRGGRQYAATPAGAASGRSDRPIVLNVSFGSREFGQIWVDTGRGEVRARGGLKATLGGMDH